MGPHPAATLAPARMTSPGRRPLGLELGLVVIVSLAVLVPGIWNYSLVDPWETHYGEVGRMMLQNHDWVHTDWPGGMDPKDHEGFRSKPVFSFWMMAASMTAFGVAKNGGYSGEMVDSVMTMVAIRTPFIVAAVIGLTLLWWMLARLVSRRMAWLGLLVVGTTPFVSLVARQALPDTPLLACIFGALAMFTMAVEDGDRPIERIATLRLGRLQLRLDHRHLFVAIVGGFLIVQCVYYVLYFHASPRLAVRRFPNPLVFFPLLFGVLCALMSSSIWNLLPRGHGGVVHRILAMARITSMRQIYLLWCYAFLGISVLAKGPPALAVVGLVGVFYVVLLGRWRDLYEGKFEIKRGLLLMIVISVPWHIGMYLKEGVRFIDEYVFTHVLSRGLSGVDNSPGTFGYYTDVIGHGMWLWAALLPPALAAALLGARTDTREGRVRFMMTLWAVCAVSFFFLVQTKFHHYILPAIPALGLLVAFFLDDILAGRHRLHPLYAALGVGIVLLVTRDLMWEPERWIEMFVFRYDRPWPHGAPWFVDPSDGFLGLGLIASAAIVLLALPWRRLGVAAVGVAGLAICIWALQAYMPDAGRHWGMREGVRTYYEQRTIYGHKNVYFSTRQFYDDWHRATDTWTFQTMIPDTLHIGQPMTIRIEVRKDGDDKVTQHEMAMIGHVTRIGDHEVEVTLFPGERAKIEELVKAGAKAKPRRVRPPIRVVDADRIVAWQLYWRGENFWTADELFGPVPEMRTGFNRTDNQAFLKYLNDRSRAPLGRRYFIITEAGRAPTVRSLLPTTRAKETFEIIDTTSNKFSLAAFYL